MKNKKLEVIVNSLVLSYSSAKAEELVKMVGKANAQVLMAYAAIWANKARSERIDENLHRAANLDPSGIKIRMSPSELEISRTARMIIG